MREAAKLVPLDRLLTETDSPFMAPEPFRGTTCEPAHVICTAERLHDYLRRGDAARDEFFARIMEVVSFLGGEAGHVA